MQVLIVENFFYNKLIQDIDKFNKSNLYLNDGNIEIIHFENMEIFIRFTFVHKPKINIPKLNPDCCRHINNFLTSKNIVNFTLNYNSFSSPSINIMLINTVSNSVIKQKINEFIKMRNKYWSYSYNLEKFLLNSCITK